MSKIKEARSNEMRTLRGSHPVGGTEGQKHTLHVIPRSFGSILDTLFLIVLVLCSFLYLVIHITTAHETAYIKGLG